MKIGLNLF